jgi:ketosteroid isomerase-like protein
MRVMPEAGSRVSTGSDVEAVRAVLHAYCRWLDARDVPTLLDQVYAVDAVDDRRRTVLRGHGAIGEYFDRAEAIVESTAHFLVNVDIQVSGDTARASSRVLASHWFLDQAHLGPARPSDCVLIGTYDDVLQRLPQGWRITRRTVGALGPGGLLMGRMPEAFRGFGGAPT